MKKIYTTLLIVFAMAQISYAQWTGGTGVIYPTTITDKVGIGTTTPNTVLEAAGGTDAASTDLLQLRSTFSSANTGTGIRFVNSPNSASNGTGGELKFIRNVNGANFVLATSSSNQFNDRLTVDYRGNVGIGTMDPGYLLDIQKVGSDATAAKLNIIGYANDDFPGSYINLAKSRGTSIGSLSVTSAEDVLGIITFSGINTNSVVTRGAQIRGTQDGSAGSGNIPGRLSFYTSQGSANNVERMTIKSNGYVGIGTTLPSSKLHIASTGMTTLTLEDLDDNTQARITQGGTVTSFIADANNIVSGSVMDFKIDGTSSTDVKMRITSAGNVGIGTISPDQKLTVNGTIHTTEVKVDLSVPAPDYVFKPDYKLATLNEVKEYVDKNHHLPEIPSATQMAKEGINVGEMNVKLLKKVEELILYLIEKDEQIANQQEQLLQQAGRIDRLENLQLKISRKKTAR